MSHTQAYEEHKSFSKGQEEVEDSEHLGQPRTSKTDEKIEKVKQIV